MKRSILFLIIFVINALFSFSAQAQYEDVTGLWRTFDDDTGKQKSIAEIYLQNGKLYGKLVDIKNKDNVCGKCAKDDPRHNKKVLGMVFITDMKVDSN